MSDTTTTDPMERMTTAGADQCLVDERCIQGLDHVGDCTDADGNPLETRGNTPQVPARVDDEVRALEQQLAAAPDVPITPEMSELTRMAQLAVTFSAAKLVPSALQGSPSDVLLIMMTARSLGLDYPTGFRELFIIDGKVSMSTKQKLALVRQRGYKVWPDPGNDEQSATWYGIRDGITYSSTFTMDDANRVEAREHQKTITLDEKSTYKQFPKRMLSWRSCGYLLDDAFSDVATGIYSPDELGAVTDADGNVIDVNEVQPLVQSDKDKRQAEQQAEKGELAPEDERRALHARMAALPKDVKEGDDGLTARWHAAGFPVPREVTVGQLRRAKALVKGFETKAKQQGWVPPDPGSAPDSPQEAPEGGDGTADTGEAPAAQETQDQPATADDQEQPEDQEPARPDDTPSEEWPDYPDDPDEQRRMVAQQLSRKVGLHDVDKATLEKVGDQVKAMAWRNVNSELVHVYGVPQEVVKKLHIDSRRMLLTGYKLAERPM